MFGILKDIARDFLEKKYIISFYVDDIDDLEELRECDLDIEVKKHREKRSLNANSYLWVLLQKLAVKLETTKWELYLHFIKEVGEFVPVSVKKKALPMLKAQWREVEVVYEHNGYVDCLCYFGSSTYDTKEMSVLINKVLESCREQKIPTMTDKEIDYLLSMWEEQHEKITNKTGQ